MYTPEPFLPKSEESVFEIITNHPFAAMVSTHHNEFRTTHLPLLLSEDKKFLIGHMAKQNPQTNLKDGEIVLCIFSGPHCYISSSWYETEKSVPTWNYIAAHITGSYRTITDPFRIKNSLTNMIQNFENPNSKLNLDNIDQNYIQNLMKGITTFEIQIQKVEGKEKLSQNHSRLRQIKVIEELEKIDSENEKSIARLMRLNLDK
ncbi:FMN-binding negative transcriptional regulator [Leptospira sp. 96542]|nr:FMN-binding negative transcriptional regulator [Leptospira sp. 96542]